MADQDYLNNYSPFDDKKDDEIPQFRLNLEETQTHPQTSNTTSISTSSVSNTTNARASFPSSSVLDNIDSSAPLTEDQIREYEENLDLLEHQINQLENSNENSRRNGINYGPNEAELPPNWPKFYPIIHFDIDEVRENLRNYVKEGFLCWFVMIGSFLLNWIGTLSLLSVENTIKSPGSKIALSSIYLFILVPLALDLNTMSVYRAMKQSSIYTFTYIKIFLALGFTCLFEFMLTLGLDSSGSVGLISTIDLLVHKNFGCGIFGIFVTVSLGASLFLHINFLRKLWKYYRGTEEGGNMENDIRQSVANYLVRLV
ncbi:hypothetical protein M9Y10_040207 [Tritrichomonas musculus]|uniref:Secretory carrier membrane protein n=1 Tax=Tritrichomonas musculus TaxID=1915356 RepID=A0ABR2GPZ0_9EUKA